MSTPGAILLALVSALLLSCSRPADGARRSFEDHYPARSGEPAVLRVKGTEIYQDGHWRKQGAVVFYDADGRETHRGHYESGLESGAWIEHEPDGARGEGAYEKGNRQGEWRYFHPGGQPQESGAYLAGQRDGAWTSWYDDGRVKGEVTWRDGVLLTKRYWNRDGSLNTAASGTYANGEKVD